MSGGSDIGQSANYIRLRCTVPLSTPSNRRDRNVEVVNSILLLCALGLATHADAGGSAVASELRPNIIFVMCDDLGWGDVGFNGNTVIRTPHLDAMAAAGLKFNRFYAAAPVCSPTRASCLTGRHPYRLAIFSANSGHLPRQELTLAEALKSAGYTTGHFGKWHLGTLTTTLREANRGGPRGAEHFAPPWEHGFDICFSTESKVPTWDPLLKPRRVARDTWWNPVAEAADAVAYGTHYWTNGTRVTENLRGDDSRIIMDRALPFVEKAAGKGQPFFAVIWFHTPHLPVVAGPEYTALYADHEDYARHYYGSITAMDEQIGRLRRTLRQLRVAENTLIFFCSDNGPEGQAGRAPGSAGPFRGRKRSLYEGGIRVPALLEWPENVAAGQSTDFPACTSDYLPTVLDILRLDPAGRIEPIDGISLFPLIEGLSTTRSRPIGFESRGQVALIGDRYKLIHVPEASRRTDDTPTEMLPFELYDLVADPAESRDLAEEHPGTVRKMAAALAQWRRSCDASREGTDYKTID